jgi:glucosylceramidase
MVTLKHLHLKKKWIVALLSVVLALGTIAPANAVWKAKIRSTIQSAPWASETALTIVNTATTTLNVAIDTATKYQTIDGFGGCFNEVGWKVLNFLSAAGRDSIIKALFDTVTGCKFNMCRMPVGASDYSNGWYSLNENANDTLMTRISVARDSGYLFQYIKAAMRYRPSLKVWGSPWSPPTWMKTNNSYIGSGGGHLIWTPKILNAFTLYLERAVQLYRAQGINFYALSFQNESVQEPIFPGCSYNQTQHHDIIANYLGPKFTADNLNCELWTATMNNGDYSYFSAMLGDVACSRYITTVCYQYAGRNCIAQVNQNYPNFKAYETETDAGDGQNTWNYAFTPTFDDMRFYFDNKTCAYFQWNMVLDPKGASTVNWLQNAMVTIDTTSRQVVYRGQYYVVKHFSYYVNPGAKVVRRTGNFTDQVTFLNPNGSIVVVIPNKGNATSQVGITVGTKMINVSLPPSSFNTAVFYDSNTTVGISSNPPAHSSVAANGVFNVAGGEKYLLPQEYAGKTCVCAIYDMKGRFIRELTVKNRIIDLAKDFGMPKGAYVVRIKTVKLGRGK